MGSLRNVSGGATLDAAWRQFVSDKEQYYVMLDEPAMAA